MLVVTVQIQTDEFSLHLLTEHGVHPSLLHRWVFRFSLRFGSAVSVHYLIFVPISSLCSHFISCGAPGLVLVPLSKMILGPNPRPISVWCLHVLIRFSPGTTVQKVAFYLKILETCNRLSSSLNNLKCWP
ncbi:hypothetical protein ILYODFUR_003133 [Ilyodon furcidens]|uniref:Uncharacterized protein n=1 Tax=Ilyodon furcidens TaxID=33524 RepID=A0ABV0UZS5_9TELE